ADRPVGDRHLEDRPRPCPLHEANLATMRTHDLRGDGEAEPGPARTHRALEGLEEAGARLFRDARPGVADAQRRDAAVALSFDPDAPDHGRIVALGNGLQRIAAEVHEDTEQLLGV